MAVFTQVSASALDVITRRFGIDGMKSFIGVADGDTESTYVLITDRQEYLVTLFESTIDPIDLERAFRTMEILRVAGVPCPATVRTREGEASIDLDHKRVAIVSVVPGNVHRQIDGAQAASLGAAIAHVHDVLLSQAPVRWTLRRGLARGWLHGALTPENIFFLGDQVSGIINFRMRHEGFLVEELAQAIAGWGVADAQIRNAVVDGLLVGYAERRLLSVEEWARLPHLVVAAIITQRAEVPSFVTLDHIHTQLTEVFAAVRARVCPIAEAASTT